VPLVIRRNEDSLVITDFRGMADEEQGVHQIVGGTHNPGDLADQICVLIMSSVNTLRRENMDLKNELVIFKNTTFNMMKNVNKSVKRIGQVPVL
jgi:hypothetical protein